MSCKITARVKEPAKISVSVSASGGAGATNYERLSHLPSINGVELIGNKTSEELALIGEIENEEILNIWNMVMN